MTGYLVLWYRTDYNRWQPCSEVFPSIELAESKLKLDQFSSPSTKHAIVSFELPNPLQFESEVSGEPV